MNLRKNASTVFIGNILYSFSKYSLLVIINHFLGTVAAGYYTYTMALIAPLYLFLRMNLRTYIATQEKEAYQLINYLYVIVINGIIGLLILGFFNLLTNTEPYLILLTPLYAIHFLFDSIYEVSYGIYQRDDKFKYIAQSKVWRAIFQSVFFAITIYFTRRLHLGLISLIIFDILFYILWDFKRSFNKISLPDNSFGKAYKKVIIEALPLGISVSLDSLLANIPKYFLESYVSIAAVGYYTSIVYIIQLGQMLITSINQTIVSRLSWAYFKELRNYFNLKKKLLMINSLIGILFIIGGFLIGEEILVILYGSEYYGSRNLLTIVLFAGLFWYINSANSIAIAATREYQKQLLILIISIISVTIISYILIPNFGIIGAAVSLLMIHIIKSISSHIVLSKIENRQIINE